jgi:tetrahydromethanopterin S-methyltransferase subunit G
MSEERASASLAAATGQVSDERSITELVGDVTQDLTQLLREEVELAKAELRQEAGKAGKAGAMLGGAAVGGILLAVFASLAAMFALGAVMPLGWAALIVAAVWAVVTAVLAASGRARLRTINPTPQRTIDTLKEDVEWARNLPR